MKQFEVELYENLVDDFTIVFQCFADNEDHAIEQAFNAYPDSDHIVNVMEL